MSQAETSSRFHYSPFFFPALSKTPPFSIQKPSFFTKTHPFLSPFSFFSVLLSLQAFGTHLVPLAEQTLWHIKSTYSINIKRWQRKMK